MPACLFGKGPGTPFGSVDRPEGTRRRIDLYRQHASSASASNTEIFRTMAFRYSKVIRLLELHAVSYFGNNKIPA